MQLWEIVGSTKGSDRILSFSQADDSFKIWEIWRHSHTFDQTDSKVNGTALSSPSTSSQRSDSSLPVLRVAASQTTDTMGKHTVAHQPAHAHSPVYHEPNLLFPVSGDDELSSPSQDASGLEEVMEQLNNSFPHSQGTTQQAVGLQHKHRCDVMLKQDQTLNKSCNVFNLLFIIKKHMNVSG